MGTRLLHLTSRPHIGNIRSVNQVCITSRDANRLTWRRDRDVYGLVRTQTPPSRGWGLARDYLPSVNDGYLHFALIWWPGCSVVCLAGPQVLYRLYTTDRHAAAPADVAVVLNIKPRPNYYGYRQALGYSHLIRVPPMDDFQCLSQGVMRCYDISVFSCKFSVNYCLS